MSSARLLTGSCLGSHHLDYMRALGHNEPRWTAGHAKARLNYERSDRSLEDPAEYVSLLKRYLQVVPALASRLSESFMDKLLSHPDLNAENIFVDIETMKISGILGWQAAVVSGPFFHHHTPRM